jgi:hypothetical protein
MSFSKAINIDQLPDARIHNPLRGKQRRPATPVAPPAPPPPAPSQGAGRGGLFSRVIPPARPPVRRTEEEEEDSDTDSDSDQSSDGDDGRRRRRSAQPMASGPFAKVANTNKHSFQVRALAPPRRPGGRYCRI